MNLNLIKYLSISAFCAAATGCVNYNVATQQKVYFYSEDTPAVTVSVNGQVIGETTCSTVLERAETYSVVFSKEGYLSESYELVPFEDPDSGKIAFIEDVYCPALKLASEESDPVVVPEVPEVPVDVEEPAVDEPVVVVDPEVVPEPEEPAVEPEDAVSEEPVADPEPEVDPEVVAEPEEPAVEPEEPVTEPEDVVSEEPVADPEPEVDPEVVAEPEEPAVESEEPVTEPEDVVSEEPVADPEPEVDPEVVAEPEEPAVEPVTKVRTMTELQAELAELKRQRKLNLISVEEFEKRMIELTEEVNRTY